MINFRGLFNKSVLTSNTTRAKRILRSNAPGAWYDPSDLTPAKATWRRNLLTYSEQFDNAAWIKAEITVVANSAIAPDGTVTADKAIPSVVNTFHGINNVALTVGVTYTATLYAKNAGYRYLALTNSGADPYVAIFDLNTGSSVKGASVISANAESVGSGWYRCAVTFVAAYTGFTQYLSTSATAITQFAGDGTSGIYIWGAQLELGSSATTYQPITDFSSDFLAAFPSHALYQDSAGTTPVTAVEQPVGLILDKSQGLVLGAELVSSLDFATWGSSGVTLKSGNSFTTSGWGGCWLAVPGWSSSKSYRINLTGACTSSWNLRNADFGLDAGSVSVPAGAFSLDVTVTSTLQNSNGNLYIQTVDAGVFTATLFSLKELPGNHLIQPTATSRPTLSSRYNLLTKTEQFDDGVWFKVGYGGGLPPTVIANDASGPASDGFADKVTFSAGAGAQSLLFTLAAFSPATYRSVLCLKAASPGDVGKIIAIRHAAGAAYLLITLTADYQVISRNETAPAAAAGSLDIVLRPEVGTSSGEASIHIAYASLTTAADAHLPYQRINTATDYDFDFSKFPPYLKFDGVDDSMYTAASIDFTSTDKMTVFAGVHKASDAAIGLVAELSSVVVGNNGSFYLAAPNAVGTFESASRGAGTAAVATGSGYTAPTTKVATVVCDIAADGSALRINGVQAATSATDQGTVNFGNYPLYIGRRNNASLPFNGRIYQLAIKGKSLSAGEVSTVESFVNSKTKAYDPYLSALLTELGDEFITESGDYITLE